MMSFKLPSRHPSLDSFSSVNAFAQPQWSLALAVASGSPTVSPDDSNPESAFRDTETGAHRLFSARLVSMSASGLLGLWTSLRHYRAEPVVFLLEGIIEDG